MYVSYLYLYPFYTCIRSVPVSVLYMYVSLLYLYPLYTCIRPVPVSVLYLYPQYMNPSYTCIRPVPVSIINLFIYDQEIMDFNGEWSNPETSMENNSQILYPTCRNISDLSKYIRPVEKNSKRKHCF